MGEKEKSIVREKAATIPFYGDGRRVGEITAGPYASYRVGVGVSHLKS